MTSAAELSASDGQADDDLGTELAISGDLVVTDAFSRTVGANAGQGAVIAFSKPAGGWAGQLSQSDELTAADGTADAHLGGSVAVAGDTVVAGATGRPPGGGAYVFHPSTTIAIAEPANGARYVVGAPVAASYSCATTPPAMLASCTGTTTNGAVVDTSTVGTHTFSVTGTDSDGIATTQTVTYTVLLKSHSGPVLSLSKVSQSHKKWRRGSKAASISRKHKKAPVGTTFAFTLSTAATVKVTFTSSVPGRKAKRRCVAPSRRNRKAKRCTRRVSAGVLTLNAHAGSDRIAFDGRVGARTLKLGRYTATFVATNSAGKSQSRSLGFTIVRR